MSFRRRLSGTFSRSCDRARIHCAKPPHPGLYRFNQAGMPTPRGRRPPPYSGVSGLCEGIIEIDEESRRLRTSLVSYVLPLNLQTMSMSINQNSQLNRTCMHFTSISAKVGAISYGSMLALTRKASSSFCSYTRDHDLQ